MPPITFYRCAKCKMVRDSYGEAERCERSHLSAVSVKETEYRYGPYPMRVSILFPDGKERDYVAFDGYYLGSEVYYANNKDKGKSKKRKRRR